MNPQSLSGCNIICDESNNTRDMVIKGDLRADFYVCVPLLLCVLKCRLIPEEHKEWLACKTTEMQLECLEKILRRILDKPVRGFEPQLIGRDGSIKDPTEVTRDVLRELWGLA